MNSNNININELMNSNNININELMNSNNINELMNSNNINELMNSNNVNINELNTQIALMIDINRLLNKENQQIYKLVEDHKRSLDETIENLKKRFELAKEMESMILELRKKLKSCN